MISSSAPTLNNLVDYAKVGFYANCDLYRQETKTRQANKNGTRSCLV